VQQLPLLLPSFKTSDAWQYSSSNLLRLAQQGARGVLEPSKPRFKPVAKPEALLRQPKVALRQLRGDVRTALQVKGYIALFLGFFFENLVLSHGQVASLSDGSNAEERVGTCKYEQTALCLEACMYVHYQQLHELSV
jgi:hypothetical protein